MQAIDVAERSRCIDRRIPDVDAQAAKESRKTARLGVKECKAEGLLKLEPTVEGKTDVNSSKCPRLVTLPSNSHVADVVSEGHARNR